MTDTSNTGFPCLLRLIIWGLFKLSPTSSASKESYAFLLDHPRRCFTLLFPDKTTWWLCGVLVILNGLDLIFFLVLNIGNNYISSVPVGYRILDGLFQVLSQHSRKLTVVSGHSHHWRCRDKLATPPPRDIGQLSCHDVYFGVPHRHDYSRHECK
jgi:Trk/Ktr/HKT type cation transporter